MGSPLTRAVMKVFKRSFREKCAFSSIVLGVLLIRAFIYERRGAASAIDVNSTLSACAVGALHVTEFHLPLLCKLQSSHVCIESLKRRHHMPGRYTPYQKYLHHSNLKSKIPGTCDHFPKKKSWHRAFFCHKK